MPIEYGFSAPAVVVVRRQRLLGILVPVDYAFTWLLLVLRVLSVSVRARLMLRVLLPLTQYNRLPSLLSFLWQRSCNVVLLSFNAIIRINFLIRARNFLIPREFCDLFLLRVRTRSFLR